MTFSLEAFLKIGDFTYNASLSTDSGILVLFGRSGVGKSLTLQMAAGLLRPASGKIRIGDDVVFDSDQGVNLPPQQRRVGYVVQNLALFPHMDAERNIMFGGAGSNKEKRNTARDLMSIVGLSGMGKRKPHTLSGGQAQRLALARAVARDATVLLLDEPFSALDEATRRDMRALLLRLRDEKGLTMIMVTHDLREAYMMADDLAVMEKGSVLHYGSKEAVFHRPLSPEEAILTGFSNILNAKIKRTGMKTVEVQMLGGNFICGSWAGDFASYLPGKNATAAIRAERINLRQTPQETVNICRATILSRFDYGSHYTLEMQTGYGNIMQIDISHRFYEIMRVGETDEWYIELPKEDLHIMIGNRGTQGIF